MKIIYLFTSPSLRGSSVQTKVLNQIKYLNVAGANCRGAFFSTEKKEITPLNEQVDLIPVEKCNWKYFAKIGQRRLLDKAMFDFVKSKDNNTDIFYLRYPGATRGLYKLAKQFGSKIVSEHQSKEIDEIKSFKSQHPFGLKPSKFLSWLLYYYLPIQHEKNWGVRFSKKVKAIVTVTNEIGKYQKLKGCKNIIVSANGIGVSDYQVKSLSNICKPLKLLFLKGTSTNAEWNGIYRLIHSIDKLEKNSSEIKLIICGHKIDGEIPQRNYIEQRGYLKNEELNHLFDEVDLGVSTLALFKKNLQEAAVLKTREYIARGLPFIYAYTDPDLNEEAKEFALEFPNDDSFIDIEKVINFANTALSDKELPNKMRKYAEDNLDYEVKMKKVFDILKSHLDVK